MPRRTRRLERCYHYNCPMDRKFFAACGLDAEALREFIATGANDVEVAVWMSQNAASTQRKLLIGAGVFWRSAVAAA